MYRNDTISALATPPGLGALAIIRISGASLNELYANLTNHSSLVHRKASLRKIYNPKTGDCLDECIIIYYNSPNSFTGEDLIEIICHGGEYVSKSILNALIMCNVRSADPGEFSFRAFMNGKIDLLQAEAISALINSKTKISANVNLRNSTGYISNIINKIKADLIDLISLIEHELDFSESEIDCTSTDRIKRKLKKIGKILESITKSSVFGKLIMSGAKVILFGPPNAGKSSLFNAMIGYERAIVSNISGTTRDTVEISLDIDGIPIQLTDTAGYCSTEDELESISINRTLMAVKDADIILFLDSKNPKAELNKLSFKIDSHKVIFIKSKCDLTNSRSNINNTDINYINTSAKEFIGLDALFTRLSTLLSTLYNYDHTTDPVLISSRQSNLIEKCNASLRNLLDHINDGISTDIISSHLHDIKQDLEEVVGEISNEDILNNIFSSFCVGK